MWLSIMQVHLWHTSWENPLAFQPSAQLLSLKLDWPVLGERVSRLRISSIREITGLIHIPYLREATGKSAWSAELCHQHLDSNPASNISVQWPDSMAFKFPSRFKSIVLWIMLNTELAAHFSFSDSSSSSSSSTSCSLLLLLGLNPNLYIWYSALKKEKKTYMYKNI